MMLVLEKRGISRKVSLIQEGNIFYSILETGRLKEVEAWLMTEMRGTGS